MIVLKRNGKKVDFDKQKIETAINKAYFEVYAKDAPFSAEIADEIEKAVRIEGDDINVEDIQDMVEDILMEEDRVVAKAYIRYRYKRGVIRSCSGEFIRAISEKIEATNVQNQNANVDENSFGGRVGEATNEMMKQYALDYCISDLARKNHLANEIYIHDLSSYAIGNHNCLSIPFDKLLAKGFNTRQTDIRPANSINTAFQLLAVIFQLQSLQQFGGVSATHLDWTMVPYVRKSFVKHGKDGYHYIARANDELDWNYLTTFSIKDKCFSEKFPEVYQYALDMTKRELQQAVEGMFHNLNTLQSRSGNQLPFTSINFGSCTLPEGRMVIKALLEGSIKGVGKLHKTPIFPCSIFQVGEGINKNPNDPNYDLFQLALKSTALRLYPNYANLDWSGNRGYDKNNPETFFSTMGLVA